MAINEPSDNLPLADVFRAANELVAAGLIEDWAKLDTILRRHKLKLPLP